MFLTRKKNRKSIQNLSHVSCTTAAAGNLNPISVVPIFAGDEVSFDPSVFVQAFPMKAPLVNGYQVCLEYFFVPDRLYNLSLNLDEAGVTENPYEVEFPTIPILNLSQTLEKVTPAGGGEAMPVFPEVTDTDRLEKMAKYIVQQGSLADFLGFPVGFAQFKNVSAAKFVALGVMGYLDIFYNYYANQQVDSFPSAKYSVTGSTSSGPNSKPVTSTTSFQLSDLEAFLRFVKRSETPGSALMNWYVQKLPGLQSTPERILGSWPWLCSRVSIFQRCQRPYFLESWLRTSGVTDVAQTVSGEDGTVTINSIRQGSHIQRWLELAMGGGSRYSDYINGQFDVSRLKNTNVPVFLGADRKFLGSNVIYQTTGAGDATSPLGTFAGQASTGENFKRRRFSFGENGTFFVIASLVPDTIYYRGFDPFLFDVTLGDKYAPALDNIGFEPLQARFLDGLSRPTVFDVSGGDGRSSRLGFTDFFDSDASVGFVPSWSKLTQVVSRAHGLLATDLRYWLLAREYGGNGPAVQNNIDAQLSDLADQVTAGSLSGSAYEALVDFLNSQRETMDPSPYIFSDKYNNVFADVSPNAQNFVLTFSCKMTVRREKAKTDMPSII